MVDARGAGVATRKGIGVAFPTIRDAAVNALIPGHALIQAARPALSDFVAGLVSGEQAAPAPARIANAQAKAVAPKYEDMPMQPDGFRGVPVTVPGAVASPVAQAAATSSADNSGLDAVIERFAAMAGGVNLNDIAMLSEAAKGNAAITKKASPKATDAIVQKYDALSEAVYNQSLAEAKKTKNADAYKSASRQRLTDLGVIVRGGDPGSANLAPQFLDQGE
jgi:hypothetical protein